MAAFPNDEHHEALDGMVNLLAKANHDLTVVHHRLEKEFQLIYPPHANPMKLVSRIKKIQDELPSLQEECRLLLSAKQGSKNLAIGNKASRCMDAYDLIDKARTILVGNRSSLQRLQASTGVPVTSDSDDPAYTNFNQVIDEWTEQIRSRTGDELCCEPGADSENINQMLFSAIVQGK